MANDKIRNIKRYDLRTIEDVMTVLENTEHELAEHDLSYLRNFNNTYLIITRNVRQHARKGDFENRAFLERFDTQFAFYYIDALSRYLNGRPTPEAWVKAFETSKKGQSSFVSMALGVNAHVNNDIPQVLHDCKARGKHHSDYKHVNGIIDASIAECIDSLFEDTALLSPKHRILSKPYGFIMKQSIVAWRALAWRNYHRFTSGKLSQQELEKEAGRIAWVIARVPA